MLGPMPYPSFSGCSNPKLRMRRRYEALVTGALVILGTPLASTHLAAQWLKYPTAGVPRKAGGSVDMLAPTPRMANGKPDFSGIWTTGEPFDRRALGLSSPKDLAGPRDPQGANDPNGQKVIELDGDLDLFGDGSILIHRLVAHTPGSEEMIVHLPKTGTVVLTSDNLYLMDNLEKDILPTVSLAFDPAGMVAGYQWLKRMRDVEGAQIFTAHDPDGYKTRKHSPEYYE